MTALIPQVERDLTYRRIDPVADGALAYDNYRATCIASFGNDRRCISEPSYVKWLGQRVEEFPDGHVFALLRGQVIGQLELQVPYGLDRGYINLFYVAKPWRRLGFGRRMHDLVLSYFRSWEAAWTELHVSPSNPAATAFYRSLGYRVSEIERNAERMWRMERPVLP